MSLTLLEVVAAVRARRASLSAETVGNLLLGVADQLIAVPREIGAEDVFLGEEGTVRIGAGRPADAERSEQALRELLDALLGAASTATPALARIGRRPSGVGIDGLLRELEAALIPVNRAAARRALNRLYRDAQRATQTAVLDVANAQAWLKRAAAPSAPTPADVVVEVSVTPPPLPSEKPVAPAEVTLPLPILKPSSRPPPLPDQRPALETLTRPEPVLVRAAARARSEPPPLPTRPRYALLAPEPATTERWAGTPRLGTFVAPVVHSVPADLLEPALELAAGEATERTPEVVSEPPALVITAPMPPCAAPEPPRPAPEPPYEAAPEPPYEAAPEPPYEAAPEPSYEAAPEEYSAELGSVVTEALVEDAEPESPPVQAELEDLDDEIMIVVDSELTPEPGSERVARAWDRDPGEPKASPGIEAEAEVLEPAATPAAAEASAAEASIEAEAAPLAESQGEAEARWWSSPEPPQLHEAPEFAAPAPAPEPEPEPEPEALVAPELIPPPPSFPALEMPTPRPAPVFEPTPLPEVDLSGVEEPRALLVPEPLPFHESTFDPEPSPFVAAAYEAEPSPFVAAAYEPEPSPFDTAYEPEPSPFVAAAYEPEPSPSFDAAAYEPEPSPYDAAVFEPEPSPFDEAMLEAAAAEFPAIADAPPSATPAPAPAEEARDLAEVGWTPAPEPIAEPVVPPPAPEPPPEPAPPRFPPRRSDVSELLRGFAVTEARSDRELCRDLKLLAGVDLTPFPGPTTLR